MAERIANPAAIEELEQDVSSLNSNMPKYLTDTGTTDQYGRVSTDISREYKLISVTVDGMAAIPWRPATGNWMALCVNASLQPVANESVTYTIAYVY